jgi:hypothetical protein
MALVAVITLVVDLPERIKRTAEAEVSVTATETHTLTPEATETPALTVTASLTSTLTPVPLSDTADVFQRLLARDPDLTSALGDRLSPQPFLVLGSTQAFERGLMIWRSDSKDIYVLFDQGAFLTFRDTWSSGMTPLSCDSSPPEDRFQPAYGFGKVWCDDPNVQEDLGFATAVEHNYSFSLQSFDSGWLIRIADSAYALVTSDDSANGVWYLLNTYDYTTISLEQQSDSSSQETNLGLGPGIKHLRGIPFDVGWKATTQCRPPFENQPTSIQLVASVANPVKVHLLLQAGWGLVEYQDQILGEVLLTFSGGSERRIPLVLGYNIRDWSRDRPNAVIMATSETLQPAWEGTAPDGAAGGMDILTIDIPAPYSSQSLETIQITDLSDGIDPCVHLLATTVRNSQ